MIISDHTFVLVANLDLIEKTYLENRPIFDEAFDGHMTLTTLKNSLITRDDLFFKILKNDLILGILLGYGPTNAQLFAQNHSQPKEKRIPLKPFTSIHPVFYCFSQVMPPCFACDPNSKETAELRKRYSQERAAIVKMNRKTPLFSRMLILFKRFHLSSGG